MAHIISPSKDKTPTIADEGLLFWWAHQDLNLFLGGRLCHLFQPTIRMEQLNHLSRHWRNIPPLADLQAVDCEFDFAQSDKKPPKGGLIITRRPEAESTGA